MWCFWSSGYEKLEYDAENLLFMVFQIQILNFQIQTRR